MKLISYADNTGQMRLGVYDKDDNIIDLTQARPAQSYFSNMNELIRAGDAGLLEIRKVLDEAKNHQAWNIDDKNIQMMAPIPVPLRNIFCVGLNYAEHVEEFLGQEQNKLPEAPIIFSKSPNTVIASGERIQSHTSVTRELDYEGELAMVIGRQGRDIPKEKAYDYVYGYTMINDITARDLQRKHQQWLLGKSLDTFCPMGPYLLHASALPNPEKLNISCRVNGETRQRSNTRHMIFDIPTLIATISLGHTLEPGDIIATGTPSGVGMAFNPPRFLKSGDVIEVEVEGLGVLKNQIA